MSFISEIHYQNSYASSSGVTEFVEVVLTADEFANAADFTMTTYQVDGTVADSISLDQLTPTYNATLDAYTYHWETPVTSPNHSPGGDDGAGEAEAVSLVNTSTNEVVSFYDIGGGASGILATEGAAAGATSENIAAASSGQSIQFDPFGHRIDEAHTTNGLPYQTFTVTGAQIGEYGFATSTGNGDDLVLELTDVEALGTGSDSYTIVVTQASDNYFNNGQFVSVVDGDGNTVFENVNVQNDAYQGRGAGDPYLVLSNGYVIDLRGLPASPTDTVYTIDDDVIGAPYAEPYGELSFDDLVGPVPCFVRGTRIATSEGEKRVEDLVCGDLVLTKDNGYQAILWTGAKRVHFSSQQDRKHLRPICIPQGEFCPNGALTVSPQHRILCAGPNVSYLCGLDEALVSAEQLRKCNGAERDYSGTSVSYFHFMTENHELVRANGNWSESLDPYFFFGEEGTQELKKELLSIFGTDIPLHIPKSTCVRPTLRTFEAKVLFGGLKQVARLSTRADA